MKVCHSLMLMSPMLFVVQNIKCDWVMITGIVIWFDMDDVSAFGLLFGELNEARVHERKLFYQNFQGGRRLV